MSTPTRENGKPRPLAAETRESIAVAGATAPAGGRDVPAVGFFHRRHNEDSGMVLQPQRYQSHQRRFMIMVGPAILAGGEAP
jgi:hypothetical protein